MASGTDTGRRRSLNRRPALEIVDMDVRRIDKVLVTLIGTKRHRRYI
jgi:hypothetical protein